MKEEKQRMKMEKLVETLDTLDRDSIIILKSPTERDSYDVSSHGDVLALRDLDTFTSLEKSTL